MPKTPNKREKGWPKGFDPLRPYNGLPPVPPAHVLETTPVLRKCIGAGRALAGLREAANLLPNPDMLINTIPLREAKDSSAIENIVTTNDSLFRFVDTQSELADAATQETLNYRTALLRGCSDISKRPLSTRTAIEVCRTIKSIDFDIRKLPGTALKSGADGSVIYTPPEGEALIRNKLADLERFLHMDDEIDPLIRMAAAHYQFEAIHPFPDGNGRTGRILNVLFLIEKGLLTLPILYLSRYIHEHRADYYKRLNGVTRDGAWEPWLLFMLEAVEDSSLWTTSKIKAIRSLMDATVNYVAAAAPKIYTRELVEILFTQPYCRIGNLVDEGIANRTTASKYLKELTAAGILRERKEGRENLYINIRLVDLLVSEEHEFVAFHPSYPRSSGTLT
jgi:Fic family protein